jgi:hypothetical protein
MFSRFGWLLLTLSLACLAVSARLHAQETNIMQSGSSFHGIRDYREVMPDVLYRGGANNGRAPLRDDQLKALCEAGFGTAVYLYRTGFSGPSRVIVKSCGRDARSGGLTPRVVSWWDSYFSVLFVNSIYELHPGTNQRQ